MYMNGIEVLDKKDVELDEHNLKEKLRSYFEALVPEKLLKIDVEAENCTVGGIRYVVNVWNKENPDRNLRIRVRDSRKHPIVYVYLQEAKGSDVDEQI